MKGPTYTKRSIGQRFSKENTAYHLVGVEDAHVSLFNNMLENFSGFMGMLVMSFEREITPTRKIKR